MIEFLKEENLKELRKDELVSDPEKDDYNFLVLNQFKVVSCLTKIRNIGLKKGEIRMLHNDVPTEY